MHLRRRIAMDLLSAPAALDCRVGLCPPRSDAVVINHVIARAIGPWRSTAEGSDKQQGTFRINPSDPHQATSALCVPRAGSRAILSMLPVIDATRYGFASVIATARANVRHDAPSAPVPVLEIARPPRPRVDLRLARRVVKTACPFLLGSIRYVLARND